MTGHCSQVVQEKRAICLAAQLARTQWGAHTPVSLHSRPPMGQANTAGRYMLSVKGWPECAPAEALQAHRIAATSTVGHV